MAAIHIRSNSLPSRIHPLTNTVEEQLQRLRSSEAASSSASASSMCHTLGGLKDLYDTLDDWFRLSCTQQVLSNQDNRQCVEDLLNGSLRTLDVCGTLREVLSLMKESLQELESSLRRRTASVNELGTYSSSRKKAIKVISRTLKDLKTAKKQNIVEVEDQEAVTILREVEKMSISVLESILSFFSKPKTRSWALVLKLVPSMRVYSEAENNANEVEALDTAMKSGKGNNEHIQKQVVALQSSIQELEEVSECVFRCLVKTRVSLLNILDH